MYKSTDIIFIKTNKRGFIPQLRICGPIVSPMKASISQCLAMLTANVPLYQFDPITKKMAELTLDNLTDDNKFAPVPAKVEKAKTPELPKVNLKVSGKETEVKVSVAKVEEKKEEKVVEVTETTEAVVATEKTVTETVVPVAETKTQSFDKGSYKKEEKNFKK